MTRLGFIVLPAALIVLGACSQDVAPSEDVGTSDDALRSCSTATSRKFHESFDECRLGNAWVLCGRPGVNDYTRDFEPQDPNVACNKFCQNVNSACSSYSSAGTLSARQDWQQATGANRRTRGYVSTCSCRALPEASPVFQTNGGVFYQGENGHYCHFPDPSYVTGLAPGVPVVNLPAIPAGLVFDGFCHPLNRAFQVGTGIFYENEGRHYCHFPAPDVYQRYLDAGGVPAVPLDQIPPGAIFDGSCQ